MSDPKKTQGFLQQIAAEFLRQYKDNRHQVAFVFPTRRAGLYFKQYLQQGISQTSWAPAILSINDFIVRQSSLRCAESLDLVVELYQIYTSAVTSFPKNFDDFYPWGKMILTDFNEIDKFLIDTEALFRSLKEFKEIEELDISGKTQMYQRFVGFWGELYSIYSTLGQELRTKGKAYEGMIYRDVAEGRGDTRPLPWSKVIFAGFNALTPAEERIIKTLFKEERAEVFWDMDSYFVDDDHQEAGLFFRKNRENLPPPCTKNWLDNKLLSRKTISIKGVQSKVSQTKVLASLLQQIHRQGTSPQDVVVVLPDESLLFPVLNSIPAEIGSVNVTMGYPLAQTPVYSLFATLVMLQKNMKGGGCYYADVIRFLNHPYIKHLYREHIPPFLQALKRDNQLVVDNIPFLAEELAVFVKNQDNPRQLIRHFLNLLAFMRGQYEEDTGIFLRIDMEYLLGFYRLLQQLDTAMQTYDIQMDISTFWQLFKDIAVNTRLPFSGEPLQGLQVMGMLETQCLDFKTVIILSLNEGFLPVGKTHHSFIPRDIRKFVNLPIYREHDAMAAYHFYRILRHAKQVELVYVESGGQGGGLARGERSRFIDQILIEYRERNDRAVISHQVYGFNFALEQVRPIKIEKTSAHIEQMLARPFSASSILTYLNCPLQFYFLYILGLREEDDLFTSPDRRLMGNIVHKTLERMYRPYINRKVVAADITQLAVPANIEKYLRQTFKDETSLEQIDTGRNRIVYEVMKRMIEHFFVDEQTDAEFKILNLEQVVQINGLTIPVAGKNRQLKLKGIIDRIDLKDDVIRIIDYKTGDVSSLGLPAINQWPLGEVIKKKEAFQLLFYWYLAVKQVISATARCRLAVYPFKALSKPLVGLSLDKEQLIGEHHLADFEAMLLGIFNLVFSPDQPFSQTEDEKRCDNCPFTTICMRGI